MRVFKFYAGPAHGWLEVPLNEARQVAGITPYSYMDKKRGLAFLEEDCDTMTFLKTVPDYIVDETPINDEGFIRNLPDFSYN